MTTYNTGNPIGSTDARDRLDNSENMDILENSTTLNEHPDRLGTMRKTRKGMELEHDNQMLSFERDFDNRLAGMAFTRVGTFTAGATLTDMRQTLLWEVSQGGDGHEYGWIGSFPKVVPPASTPAGTGGIGAGAWVDRTDLTLRGELSRTNGAHLSGNAAFYIDDVLSANVTNIPDKAIIIARTRNGNPAGGGVFEYASTSVLTADNGVIFAPTTGSGRLIRIGYTVFGFNGPIQATWFGCVADGVTDDGQSINSALNYAAISSGTVLLPSGIMLINTTVSVPPLVNLIGHGRLSELRAGSNITIVKTKEETSGYGNRYGEISGIYINGANIGSVGLMVSFVCVQRLFKSIAIENCTYFGLIVEGAQNNEFMNVDVERNASNLYLINGAGNNNFIRCEFSDTTGDFNVFLNSDASYQGYATGLFSSIPQANKFNKCVFERGASPHQVLILSGKGNIFEDCDMPPSETGLGSVYTGDTNSELNKFIRCRTTGTTGQYFAKSHGYRTLFSMCDLDGFPTGANVFYVAAQTSILDCHMPTYKVVNEYGNLLDHVIFSPIETRCTTASRPDYGQTGIYSIFDDSLGKPIWKYNSNWVDSAGAIV